MTDYPTPAGPAQHSVREEAVELAALSWFDLVGWRTVSGEQLAPGASMGARNDYRQCVLEPELRSALAALNPQATPSMITAAVSRLTEVPSQDLKENNRAFHRLLAEGFSVEASHLGEGRWEPIRLFDRDVLANNRWLVANQFVVHGEREVIRPDIVAFVNGLPLAVLELKSPVHEQATLETAFTQLQNYKSKAPELFRTNQVLVISDGLNARIGSLTAGQDRFGPWRTINGDQAGRHGQAGAGGADPRRVREGAVPRPRDRLRRLRGRRRRGEVQEAGGLPPVPRRAEGARLRGAGGGGRRRPARRGGVAHPGQRQVAHHAVLRAAAAAGQAAEEPHRRAGDRSQRSG